MRIVLALGGNALLRRGETLSAEHQRANVQLACAQIALLARGHELVIVHGNGPQVGLLALQNAAYTAVAPYPLDVLGAESEGMIGYMIEQELVNLLPDGPACATLLTMIEVDSADPAFSRPDKPIGAMMNEAQADAARQIAGWSVAPDGAGFRRVVPSPKPVRVLEMPAIRCLLDAGIIVICAGGGGIPVVLAEHGGRQGIEGVIDKDRSASLLARDIGADLLVIATDIAGVSLDWGSPTARMISRANPDDLAALDFAAGSMAPKIEAACAFARLGGRAVIGALADIEDMIAGTAGTSISTSHIGIQESTPP